MFVLTNCQLVLLDLTGLCVSVCHNLFYFLSSPSPAQTSLPFPIQGRYLGTWKQTEIYIYCCDILEDISGLVEDNDRGWGEVMLPIHQLDDFPT